MEQRINAKTDDELIESIKQSSCSDSLKELVNRYQYFYLGIYKRYFDRFDSSYIADRDYVVYQSAITYKREKAKFDTWLGCRIRYFCLDEIKDRTQTIFCEGDNLEEIEDGYQTETKFISELRDDILNILDSFSDKRIKHIYELRYFSQPKKLTKWEQIANNLNLSIEWTRQLHNSALKVIRKKLISGQVLNKINNTIYAKQ